MLFREGQGPGQTLSGPRLGSETLPRTNQRFLRLPKMGLAAILEPPMNGDDVYRRHAAEAERQARLAINDLDRAAWLRVAQGWMNLLKKRPQSEDDSEPPK
jgi:hypothetical protein